MVRSIENRVVREDLLEKMIFHQSVMGEGVNRGLFGKRSSWEERSVSAEALRGECPQQEPSVTGAE